MPTLSPWVLLTLQTVASPDTIVARTIPVRGFLDWTNGLLQLVVLLLAVAALSGFIWLIITIRRAVESVTRQVDKFAAESRPLISEASDLVRESREAVAVLRRGAEDISEGATALSEELLNIADSAAQRVDEVNAVLDVLQEGLEDAAISAASAARGISTGAAVLAAGMFKGRKKQRRPSALERRSDHEPGRRSIPDDDYGY